jgi:hypothetical protein
MRRVIIFLIFAIFGAALTSTVIPADATYSAAVSAQRSCPKGRTLCAPGREGNGGCYEFGPSYCTEGQVCRRGTFVCRRGVLGSGGCYDPGHVMCVDGLRCARGSSICRPGRSGGGGCYDASRYSCSDGRLTMRRR